jgi:hypothetical protein
MAQPDCVNHRSADRRIAKRLTSCKMDELLEIFRQLAETGVAGHFAPGDQ